MKREIKGKRFTKRELVSFDTGQELAECMIEHGTPDGAGRYRMGASFNDLLEGAEKGARAVLRGAGLPDTPQVVKLRGGPWQPRTPDLEVNAANVQGFMTIDRYVCGELGHEHDSPEGMAARMLDTASMAREDIKRGDMDGALLEAWRLGGMREQARILGYLRAEQGSGAAATNAERDKSHAAAREKAKRYCAEHPNARKPEIIAQVESYLHETGLWWPEDQQTTWNWLTEEPRVVPKSASLGGRPRKT